MNDKARKPSSPDEIQAALGGGCLLYTSDAADDSALV